MARHGPKLTYAEVMSPKPDPHLPEEDLPAVIQLDEERNRDQERQLQRETQRAEQHVGDTLASGWHVNGRPCLPDIRARLSRVSPPAPMSLHNDSNDPLQIAPGQARAGRE